MVKKVFIFILTLSLIILSGIALFSDGESDNSDLFSLESLHGVDNLENTELEHKEYYSDKDLRISPVHGEETSTELQILPNDEHVTILPEGVQLPIFETANVYTVDENRHKTEVEEDADKVIFKLLNEESTKASLEALNLDEIVQIKKDLKVLEDQIHSLANSDDTLNLELAQNQLQELKDRLELLE